MLSLGQDNCLECTTYLLENGVDVNLESENLHYTALDWAMWEAKEEGAQNQEMQELLRWWSARPGPGPRRPPRQHAGDDTEYVPLYQTPYVPQMCSVATPMAWAHACM